MTYTKNYFAPITPRLIHPCYLTSKSEIPRTTIIHFNMPLHSVLYYTYYTGAAKTLLWCILISRGTDILTPNKLIRVCIMPVGVLLSAHCGFWKLLFFSTNRWNKLLAVRLISTRFIDAGKSEIRFSCIVGCSSHSWFLFDWAIARCLCSLQPGWMSIQKGQTNEGGFKWKRVPLTR